MVVVSIAVSNYPVLYNPALQDSKKNVQSLPVLWLH